VLPQGLLCWLHEDRREDQARRLTVMLIRTDPFRELDRLTQQILGTATRPAAMPMDAYRKGDSFYVHFDLPGVRAESIALTVEHNVLSVRAERLPVESQGTEMIVAERPSGTFSRQVFLGETLDAEHIAADYTAGVLTLTIPVRESAKPRSIHVTSRDEKQSVTS
jgi:HSP20 family protein